MSNKMIIRIARIVLALLTWAASGIAGQNSSAPAFIFIILWCTIVYLIIGTYERGGKDD